MGFKFAAVTTICKKNKKTKGKLFSSTITVQIPRVNINMLVQMREFSLIG